MTAGPAPGGWKRAQDLELADIGQEVGSSILAYALILVASALLSAGAAGLAVLLPWLHWPVVILLGLFTLVPPLTIFNFLRVWAARKDTATSTIRAAPQGLVEIRARVEPIPGRELISPLFGAACGYHRSIVNGWRKSGALMSEVMVLASESRSILLDDGVAQVFVPGDANMISEIDLVARQTLTTFPDEWRPLLREPGIDLERYESYAVEEHLVPAGLTLQVNGEFRTLSADDSYLTARAAALGLAPPSPEDLAADPVEQDWRAYCSHLAAMAGQGGAAVRVNAILPDRSGPAWLNLTDARDGRLRQTVHLSVCLLLMGIPPALTVAWMTGLLPW